MTEATVFEVQVVSDDGRTVLGTFSRRPLMPSLTAAQVGSWSLNPPTGARAARHRQGKRASFTGLKRSIRRTAIEIIAASEEGRVENPTSGQFVDADRMLYRFPTGPNSDFEVNADKAAALLTRVADFGVDRIRVSDLRRAVNDYRDLL